MTKTKTAHRLIKLQYKQIQIRSKACSNIQESKKQHKEFLMKIIIFISENDWDNLEMYLYYKDEYDFKNDTDVVLNEIFTSYYFVIKIYNIFKNLLENEKAENIIKKYFDIDNVI